MTDTEFARVLRAWRDRLDPTVVGMPGGPGRRAAGLRREELAALAGLSVDYIVRLEQGRAEHPSPQVVGSLARALQLNATERDHLFVAAGLPAPTAATVPTHVPPGIQRMLARMTDTPCALFTADWTLLAANPLWDALQGDTSEQRGRARNIAWRAFTGMPGGIQHAPGGFDRFERALASDLRRVGAQYPNDRQVAALVADLCEQSPRFAELWDQAVVAEHVSERKTIVHPEVGALNLDCDVLAVPGADIRIVLYTATPGSVDAERLALLAVTGLQSLRPAR